MKTISYSIIFILLLVLSGCAGFWPFGERDGFVNVHGSHFLYNNHPYYFIGANLWYGAYLGSAGSYGNRERLIRELDSLHEMGVDNLRILAGSEQSHMKRSVRPSFTRSPGEYDPQLLEGLDFLLSEMAKRRMKAVLYLTNYWEWSGGISQYITWADSTKSIDPDRDGWGTYMDFCASFYTNEKANMIFRNYVRMLIARKNTVNHREYSSDPTIMSWQLMNEPRPGSSMDNASAMVPSYVHWIDETAGFIKSLDTNHLVCTGSEGIIGSLKSKDVYLLAHRSTNIDYLTFHCWASNWGWYDPRYPDSTLPVAEAEARRYIDSNIACARLLNKPIVMEEFGIGRDNGIFIPGSATTVRDRYYNSIFSTVYDSAHDGAPMAGCSFWAWGGEGRTSNPDDMWKQGDAFVGDPPQEAQGLNSVFDVDTSTIAVIRLYALTMHGLCMNENYVEEIK